VRERALGLALAVALLAAASACATPVGVVSEDPKALYRSLAQNALSAGRPTPFTEQLLRRHGLEARFKKAPEALLDELHRTHLAQESDRLFALAELCFLHAKREGKRDYYLASAVYAYAFLESPEMKGAVAPAADPRFRVAADLYNVGMTFALTVTPPAPIENGSKPEPNEVVLGERNLPLPFGRVELRSPPEQFLWGGYRMSRFIPLIEYKVRGLRNRYRQPGFGVPLAAELTPVMAGPQVEAARRRIPPRIKVPVTAVVRFENVGDGLANGQLRADVALYAADETTTVEVNGATMPLETEPTATLAYTLEGAPVWDTELTGFLRGDRPVFGGGLVMTHPYQAGRIPVVLIHGTASSPARWAELLNEVQNDPALRQRVQLWLFTYNTSNPILLSAALLREQLRSAVRDLDPEGRDPALRRMVLIGHSQGGLLARLMVIESGTRFWDNVSTEPLSQITMPPETRDLLQRTMFFEPVPFVTRVVYIATPHGGSFRATGFVRRLVRRVVTVPSTLGKSVAEIIEQNPGRLAREIDDELPTSVDNMRPGHRFLRALSACAPAPGVTAHSIIAARGTGTRLDGSDGVVTYRSAHLEGVASEKVVRWGHSVQSHPETILEVRRILREHLAVP